MPTIAPDARATIYTSMGEIALDLLVKKAPRTVENFVKLAHKGFYDGLTFHRILKDFVIQGGCPKGDGTGGPGYTIRPEFNDTPHVPGTVSMARDNDPHSAGSQFFICAGEAAYLDSRFSAFGQVSDGLDVVEKIASVKTHDANRFKEKSTPLDPVYINRIELEGVEFDDEAAPDAPSQAADDEAPAEAESSEGGGRGKRRRSGKRADSGDKDAEQGGGKRARKGADKAEGAGDEAGPGDEPAAEEKPKRPRKAAKPKAKADDGASADEKKPRRPRRKSTKKKSDDAETQE